MRISSLAIYILIGMMGIITTGVIADQRPEDPMPVYAIGITLTLLSFPLVVLGDARGQPGNRGGDRMKKNAF